VQQSKLRPNTIQTRSERLKMSFRNDINGLRAIAVLAVVFFHFDKQWLPGGFAGVDVFFVISGYLMTSIIYRGLENNNFSIANFYLARGYRIIPALAVLCAALLIFGWFLLIPNEYATLGKHLSSSMSFISNFVYWQEAGYFTADSHEKWLLHTWSLSVEWQFYLLYPILLLILGRYIPLKKVRNVLLVGVILCFIFTIYASYQWKEAAFFLLPTRAWEMLMGGIAFCYPVTVKRKTKKSLEFLGFFLILVSYIFLSGKDIWPGYLSALPVVGTFLVIAANRQESLLTNNVIFQRIGSASYSIYLWHWPVVVYLYKYIPSPNLTQLFIAIIVSFVLGFLSYHLVENTLTKWKLTRRKKTKLVFFLQLITTLSFVVFILDGVTSNLRSFSVTPKTVFLEKYARVNYLKTVEKNYRNECNFFDGESYSAKSHIDESCVTGESKGGVFLWGDSHAQALYFGIQELLPKNIPFYQVATSGCSVTMNSSTISNDPLSISCERSNQYAVNKIRALKPDIVIIAQRNGHDKIPIESLINSINAEIATKVIIVGPVPQWEPSLPNVIANKYWDKDIQTIEKRSVNQSILTLDKKLRKYNFNSDKVKYISLIEGLCIEKECLVKVPLSEELLVWDYGHLTSLGSVFIVNKFLIPELI